MASGWAFGLCVVAYALSKKKITPDDVIKLLDEFWNNEHIRSHMEKAFEDVSKKFEGTQFGKVIKSWWDTDDEENGDAAAVEKETSPDKEEEKKKDEPVTEAKKETVEADKKEK